MSSLRTVAVLVLSCLLVFAGCAARVTHAAPEQAAAAPRSGETDSSEEGVPRWAWITLGAVTVAATIAVLFAFVIVPGAAKNAARAATPDFEGRNGEDGLTLP